MSARPVLSLRFRPGTGEPGAPEAAVNGLEMILVVIILAGLSQLSLVGLVEPYADKAHPVGSYSERVCAQWNLSAVVSCGD